MKNFLLLSFSIILFTGSSWSQNVGIGTATPGDKLEININLRFIAANPVITARYYLVIPNGAYFRVLLIGER